MRYSTFILSICSVLATATLFADTVVLQALFNNKAMVSINGKSILLVKDKPVQGYRLIKSDSYEAVIEFNGQARRYTINGSPVQSRYSAGKELAAVTIWPNKRGLYETGGSVNGLHADFLIDTGASVVAMNESHARAFSISTEKALRIKVETASGSLIGRQVKLRVVKIGGIVVNNVDAVILPGNFPRKILLGNAFLKNIEMKRQGQAILLQARPY